MNKLSGFIRLMRLPNDFVIGLAVLVGEVMGLGSLPPLDIAFYGFFSGFFTCASIMVLNDVFDIDIDKINAPHRPLPSGLISSSSAIVFAVILFLLGLFTSLVISLLNLSIVVGFWILGILYNWSLKKTGFLGNIIVSLSVAIPFFYGAVATGRGFDLLVLLFSLMAFLTNLGREIIKGIIDMKGDREGSVMTIAVRYGSGTAYYVAVAVIVIAILISPVPIILNIINIYLYMPLVSLTDILLIYALVKANSSKQGDLFRAKKFILYGMAIGILAFMFGVLGL